jgi:hypothetical protein
VVPQPIDVILLSCQLARRPELVRAFQRAGARHVVAVASGAESQAAVAAGAVLVRPRGRGEGALIRAAVAHLSALPQPPAIVAFFAGDGSNDPAFLPTLTRPLAEGHFDLALGSRVLGEADLPVPEDASRLLTVNLIHAIYGHRYSDVSTLRAVRMPALVALALGDDSAGIWGEMLVKALRRGLRVAEVPVMVRKSQAGRSRARGWAYVARVGRALFHILRHATIR